MSEISKRSTVYFDPQLHAALRLKAAHTHRSLSDIVNDAVRAALAEDRCTGPQTADVSLLESFNERLSCYCMPFHRLSYLFSLLSKNAECSEGYECTIFERCGGPRGL